MIKIPVSSKTFVALATVLSVALGAAVQQQLFPPDVMGWVVGAMALLKALASASGGDTHVDDLPGSRS
jgi:hypothetical protein